MITDGNGGLICTEARHKAGHPESVQSQRSGAGALAVGEASVYTGWSCFPNINEKVVLCNFLGGRNVNQFSIKSVVCQM